jgi:hypothetical protein
MDAALTEFMRAQELDPLTFFFGVNVAWPLHYGGR